MTSNLIWILYMTTCWKVINEVELRNSFAHEDLVDYFSFFFFLGIGKILYTPNAVQFGLIWKKQLATPLDKCARARGREGKNSSEGIENLSLQDGGRRDFGKGPFASNCHKLNASYSFGHAKRKGKLGLTGWKRYEKGKKGQKGWKPIRNGREPGYGKRGVRISMLPLPLTKMAFMYI